MLAGMNTALLVAGSVFVSIAALIHVYIFVLESLRWSRPATWKTFGLKSQADADVVKPMAFNQGFYNLFLAIVTAIGIASVALGHRSVGIALVLAGVGSMAAASVVLLASAPDKARAAVVQGSLPVIAIALLVLHMV